jgi:uncharacterized SAM-binding protein YcdF (DUF218 family)
VPPATGTYLMPPGERLGRATRLQRVVLSLLIVGLCVTAWFEREVILVELAANWIVGDAIAPADAAVVLGGGLDTRPLEAARLFRSGLVKKVLVSKVAEDRVSLGFTSSHTELNRQVLIRLGVPETAVETFGGDNRNTYDEAVALAARTRQSGGASYIVPTEIFSTRRVRYIFRHEMTDGEAQISVDAIEPGGYGARDWWKSTSGVIAFQTEVLKYFYYRLTFRGT